MPTFKANALCPVGSLHTGAFISTKQFQETLHMQVVEKIEIATDGE